MGCCKNMKNCLSDFIRIYRNIYKLPEIKNHKYTGDLYLFLYTNDKQICKYGFSGILHNNNIHQTLTELVGPMQIGEIMPVAILNNKSLVFVARIINNMEPAQSNIVITNKMSKYISNIIHDFDSDYLQNTEIEIGYRYKLRYWIHNNIIKRFLLTRRLKKLDTFDRLLSDKLTGRAILDVSCGDSNLLNMKTKANLIVFNDITMIIKK